MVQARAYGFRERFATYHNYVTHTMTRGNPSTGALSMSLLWCWRGAPVWACRMKGVIVPVGRRVSYSFQSSGSSAIQTEFPGHLMGLRRFVNTGRKSAHLGTFACSQIRKFQRCISSMGSPVHGR